MTERLTTLLRDEAQGLDIPVPPTSVVLATGRGLRRRRQLATGVAAAAALAVAATGAVFAVGQLGDGDTRGAPAATEAGDLAYSVGRDVRLGGVDDPVVTLDEDIHSLHYTSEGVVVRTNRNEGVSDGSGPEHFTLVRSDGTTRGLAVTTNDIVVSTDLDQPFLAYSDLKSDGTAQVVLHDVGTDQEAARIDLPGRYVADGWPSPPVWLDGDTVYVGFGDDTLAVDWATGDVERAAHLDGAGIPDVYDGRAAAYQHIGDRQDARGLAQVIDAQTGEVLLSVEVRDFGSFVLAPDGQHALLQVDSAEGESSFDVYDVATGAKATIGRSVYGFGWTVDGDLFRLEGGDLVVCDADSGVCRSDPSGVAPDDVLGPGEPEQGVLSVCDENGKCRPVEGEEPQQLPVKVGGRLYES